MKVMYFDCAAGVSGEMLTGSLLDLGADIHALARVLSCVKLDAEYEITKETVTKGGISATAFSVKTDIAGDEMIFGEEIISKIISSKLTDSVKKKSAKAFLKLISAESVVCGKPCESIAFLKEEAVNDAVLIISFMSLLENFAPEAVVFSHIAEGSGFVNKKGTVFSIPEPVVSEVLRQKQAPIIFTEAPKELITPVGAAILAEIAESFTEPYSLIIKAVGYGASELELANRPAVLRVILGETLSGANAEIQYDFNAESSSLFFNTFGYNMNKIK